MNDNELLARLKAADPASLRGAPEPDLDRLLEKTMATTTTTRRRWIPAAAAAAVVIAAGGVVWGVNANDNPPIAVPPAPTVKLTMAGGAAGKCRAPEVADFKDLKVAFEGQVTAIKGDLVTLKVAHWYSGGPAESVEVESKPLEVVLYHVDFTVGGSYLVSAANGQVSICGHSGPSDPELRKLFEAAYPG
ncbi:hypothetical protein E1263_25050 [Kribbella antibiotica]|uniref:Uncharacterized protein n=1 Tax=Kribbella antibiotica TaxID=190195 RepID=A0A4R4ZFN6_9ACTN|nr:hypothetical protein [Kribbella antibiotica]TDD56850.1 hypothetical protein E1263_25050 [Kribbella antibiotica]